MISKIRSLFQHQGFVKYFKNTSWLFAEKILRMTVGLFVSVWVARYLGPDRFGLLSYAQSFVGLFAPIAALGLDGIIVRDIVKYPEKENELLGTAFILKLLGTIILFIILYIAIHFTSNDNYTNLLVFIIASAVLFQTFNVIDFYFQAKVMSKYIVFANSFSLFLSSVIKIVLIIKKAPLIAFAGMVVFDNLIMALGYIYCYLKIKKEFFIKKIRFEFKIAKQLLIDSFPLILSGMAISIYMKIDQIMIKEMLNNKAVGNYAAAVKISEAWYFISVIISNSLFPAIINAKKLNENLYYERLQKLYFLMVWIAICIALFMTFFSNCLINLLYGDLYNKSADVLKIHIWAGIFIFLLNASGKFLILEHLSKHAFYRNISGALINILLNLILIKYYGILGAALATLISYMFSGLLYDFFDKKLRKNFYLKLNAFNILNFNGKVEL
jgi:O-antigen/teichoic acid export membrane protein